MICRCGYQSEPDDIYCAQCGKKLSHRKKGAKGWIIAIVVVLFLAASGVAAWFLAPWDEIFDKPQEETQTEEETQEPQAVRPEDVREPEVEETPDEGWDSSRTCYYEGGKAVSGLRQIEGEYFYFDVETCQKQTGWVEIEGSWHFFTEEGPAPGAGWYSDTKGWFYLEEDGKHLRVSPFLDEQNKREYILDEDGYLTRMECMELVCIEITEEIDGSTKPALMVPGMVTNCTGLTFHCAEVASITPVDAPVWEIWIRQGEEWTRITDAPVKQGEGTYTLSFAQPQTFDAICIYASRDLRVKSTLTDVILDY